MTDLQPFLGTFESLRLTSTFSRGRRDARNGYVRSLTISSSLVVARVRGPEDRAAFRARIAVRAFGAAEWARVEDALAAQARFVADLLDGRMPAGIDRIFTEAGLTLLPLSLDDVAMDCTCERWPMPCVHLAATLYELARSFDTDPFGVFAWRGRTREELLDRLRRLRGAVAVAAFDPPAEPPPSASPGLGDPADFWGTDAVPPAAPPARTRPDVLLDQLDPPPLGDDLIEKLRPAYLALPVDE
ncbi:hypothetical protein AB0M54_31835 [Actinoplanes sp. NPDC051470]|uniref:SWIM zinc finger family protein n=1 Tax=Actinoplanes sp. NPDC051470 TaxID=3157224 RepID=UPI003429B6C5